MNKVQLCYFVGNANGRGLVRIEIDGNSENAGFHVASATRGKESWIAALVDRWNAHAALVEALTLALDYAGYYKDGQPHVPAWVPKAREALKAAGVSS